MGCTNSADDVMHIPIPPSSHSYTNYRPQSRHENGQLLHFHEDEHHHSVFDSILSHFDVVDEGSEKEKVFYDLLGNKMGELYTDTLTSIEDKMIKGEVSTDDLKVSFSKIILLNVLSMINKLQNRPNWKTQRVKFFFQIARCQKKIIEFLKFKYPRNSKDFVPTELEEIFQNVDDSEHTDYDLLINSGINFDFEKVQAYERKEVIKQIKSFINACIRETNRSFEHFRVNMEEVFHNVEGNFKIGRKISENVNVYTELESESIQIYSPEIFRIIIKWISSMDGIFFKSQDILKQKKYLKILEQDDEQFHYFPLYTGKASIISSLASALEPGSKEYLRQQQNQQSNLANFNDTVAKILTKKTDIPEINQNQIKTIKYAKYISKFVQFLAIENLIYLITQLVSLREKMNKKNRKAVDLIICDVNDLLRCQFMGGKTSILQVFQNLKKMETNGEIKIIRIKNRFATPLNDALINFRFVGEFDSFIVCEIQLILKKSGSAANPKFDAFEKVNHVLYELERSIFGPMAEMSLLLTHNDTRMGYEKKIKLEKSTLQTMRCPQGEILNCEYDLSIPYVCSLCSAFNHISQNAFPIHRCLNCNFYLCPECLFEFDPQYSEECYFKEIFNVLKESFLPELEQHQDYGFFFFNKKYLKVKDIIKKGKNFFDCLEEKMSDLEQEYAFIIKLYEGKRYINIYTNYSGELLPCFYDFLPRLDRKNFKSQTFGPFDIVLFLDPNCSVIVKPSKDSNLTPIFLTPEDIPMKKVKEIRYFRWQSNFYLIDVGEQIRDNDSNTSAHSMSYNADKLTELDKILENYRERDGQLLLDYMDINHLKFGKNIENVRFAKLKSNRLSDLGPIFQFTTLEEVDASRNQIVQVKLAQSYPKLRVLDLSENYLQNFEGFHDQCIPSIKELNLSNNLIVNLPVLKLSKLLWLDLTNNQLEEVSKLSESMLPKLRKLSISENSISKVPEIRMNELQEFDADQNKLTDLSFILGFPKIEQVNVKDNKIIHIPKMELQYLENLCVVKNEVKNINEFAESFLPQLKVLDLEKNKIKQLPILRFEQLVELDVSENELEHIGNLYKSTQMYKIESINLSTNRIKELSILDLETLTKLDISKNKIKDLSPLVHSKIFNLKEMNASFNEINHIPTIDLPMLHKLNLEKNLLKNMDFFRDSNVPQLLSLNLAQNSIAKFLSAEFPALQELFIDRNCLTDISEIKEEHLQVLKVLNMSENKINELPSMYLQSVQKLYLSSNQIQIVHKFKESVFPKLKHLDLRFNQLKAFPEMKLNTLETLLLNSNQIIDMNGLVNSQLDSLSELQLPSNKIVTIKSLKLANLTVLNLEANSLQSIEDLEGFQTPEISVIKLSGNLIKQLCSLKSASLTEIDLSHNKIENVDQFFEQSDLPKLLFIKLNSNGIDGDFPAVKMPNLKSIDFSKNQIKNLQSFGVESLAPKLDTIKGNNNKIGYLGEMNFPKLKDLDLSNNLIKEIELFVDSELPKIQKINLQNNQLTALPRMEINSLTNLNLDANQIHNLQQFERSDLPSLEKLLLRDNKIAQWPQDIYFDKLIKLNLSENELTHFKNINQDTTPELKELILKKNKITELHQLRLPKLLILNLDNNPALDSEKVVREGLKLNESKVHKRLKLGLNRKTSEKEGGMEEFEVVKLKQRMSANS